MITWTSIEATAKENLNSINDDLTKSTQKY